jgi:hypothetical protein
MMKRRCGSGWDSNQKTSILRGSAHWWSDGTSVSMLVEDVSRNKYFFQVRISHVLGFISICYLFTDSPSYFIVVRHAAYSDNHIRTRVRLVLSCLYQWHFPRLQGQH